MSDLRRVHQLAYTGVGLAAVGAILNSFTPLWQPLEWIMASFILASCATTLAGVGYAQRYWEDMNEALDLQEKWRHQRERSR